MSTEPVTTPHHPPAPSRESRIHGCLLGGALGDSLGYAVEFDDISTIRARFGPDGLRDFSALDGGSHFSDDTQLTLYTVDGLLEALEWANSGVAADTNACLWLAYLRWLATRVSRFRRRRRSSRRAGSIPTASSSTAAPRGTPA